MDSDAGVFAMVLVCLLGLFYVSFRYGGYRQRQLDKPAIMDQMEKIYWEGYEHGEKEQHMVDEGLCK